MGARTLRGLSQNGRGMLAGHFACFSTALLTLVVHIWGKSEWHWKRMEVKMKKWRWINKHTTILAITMPVYGAETEGSRPKVLTLSKEPTITSKWSTRLKKKKKFSPARFSLNTFITSFKNAYSCKILLLKFCFLKKHTQRFSAHNETDCHSIPSFLNTKVIQRKTLFFFFCTLHNHQQF